MHLTCYNPFFIASCVILITVKWQINCKFKKTTQLSMDSAKCHNLIFLFILFHCRYQNIFLGIHGASRKPSIETPSNRKTTFFFPTNVIEKESIYFHTGTFRRRCMTKCMDMLLPLDKHRSLDAHRPVTVASINWAACTLMVSPSHWWNSKIC